MNDIAREAGYFIDLKSNKESGHIYMEIGAAYADMVGDYTQPCVMSSNNFLMKLEDNDGKLIKILDMTELSHYNDGDEWQCLSALARKVVENLKVTHKIADKFIKIELED